MARRSTPSPRPVPRSEPKRSASKAESRAYFKGLGKRICLLRNAHGYTQADLARMLGVSQQTVLAYEFGTRRTSALILVKLARAFSMSLDELVAAPLPERVAESGVTPATMRYADRLQALTVSQRRVLTHVLDALEERNSARLTASRRAV